MFLEWTTGVVLSLLILSNIVLCMPIDISECNEEKYCPYGQCLDEKCRCNLQCQKFTANELVCVRGVTQIKTLCEALSDACVGNITSGFRTVPDTKNFTSCDHVFENTDPEEDRFFCKDQRVCSNNGVCVQDTNFSQGYCRCNDEFTGPSCVERNERTSSQSSVSIHPPTSTSTISTTTLSLHNSPNGHSSNLLSPTPMIAIATCMLCCCLIFVTVQNRNRKKEKSTGCRNNDDASQEHKQSFQSSLTENNSKNKSNFKSHCIFMESSSMRKNEDKCFQEHLNNKNDLVILMNSQPLTTVKLL